MQAVYKTAYFQKLLSLSPFLLKAPDPAYIGNALYKNENIRFVFSKSDVPIFVLFYSIMRFHKIIVLCFISLGASMLFSDAKDS